MKIVLSRKGFDSTTGGGPSPILDEALISLPIPDAHGSVRFSDVEPSIGRLVSDLTGGRIESDAPAHLDPDLRRGALRRRPDGWRPAFGQVGPAQGHLARCGVGVGDLFLFFGLFRQAYEDPRDGRVRWVPDARNQHVIFGWMEVEEVLRLHRDGPMHAGLRCHPHVTHKFGANDTQARHAIATASHPSPPRAGVQQPRCW